jgi:hypothetical protein
VVAKTLAPRHARPRGASSGALKAEIQHQGRSLAAPAEGLSGQGVFLRTPERFPVGTLLWLVISSPEQATPLRVRGRVSYLRMDGLGVGFDPTSVEDCGRIMDWLSTLQPPGRGS